MKKLLSILLLVFFVFVSIGQAEEARLLRQPHIWNNRVVFVYAGDIWIVSAKGGVARKLTSFKGLELFPQFSPDGKWIAFSGEYPGTREIYIIPSEGGVPKQLTFYPDVGQMPPRGGWDNIPIDWTPDSKKILIRSNRTPYGRRVSRYFLVNPFHEGLEQPLQIPEGGPATLSPDGTKLAYDIKSREFRTWKRYKAGRAQDVWIYDLKANTIKRLTTYPGTDNFPMWVDSTIYFTSDRKSVDSNEPRILNIFAYDLRTNKIHQITHFTRYDCLWPSRGKGGIVFENGGYIYLLDPKTEEYHKILIEINDDKPYARPVYKNVAKFVDSFTISPSGKRAIFSARGDIFTVPEKYGDIRNITETEGIREMSVDWSPDGKTVSYLSEKPGDYELFLQKYNSDEPPVQVTKNTGTWITGYRWSPGSKKIAIVDKMNRLHLLDLESRKIKLVDSGVYSSITGYRWSPDNRWIVYAKDSENYMTSIWLYSLDQEKTFQLTSDREDEYDPVFDSEGKYLYFISRRDYNWQKRNFDAKLYVGTLKENMASPFAPRNDDEIPESKKDEEKDKSEKKSEEKKETKKIVIDVEGFNNRITAFPLKTGSYKSLNVVKGEVLYLRDGDLYKFDMKSRKEALIMKKVSAYSVAAKGKKFIYRSGDTYGIADVKPNMESGEGKLNLKKMEMKIVPTVEWEQIYRDAWRIMRDWFYDPGMHGVDWKKIYKKYVVLVPYVANRADLDYIIGEMVGELNCGHTYVFSGDMEKVKRVPVGVLGCELVPEGKFYKIAKIFPGENWDKSMKSPLTEPGINIKVGEYLIGIDGKIIHTDENPYRFLENKAGVEVTLLINSKPTESGSRKVVVRPAASELALLHHQWVERNRAIVDSLSGGKIGYIYVPNTSFEGFKRFYQGWFEQSTKEGLIIDERYNGGGSLPAPMIFDLAHPLLNYWAVRYLRLQTTPTFVNEGPKVMLINGRSSSGGDAFPAYFRTMKLGPLMGQTTWGGLVGYSWSPRFVDGGGTSVPSFAYVNREGKWDVEYYGVKPDIEVFDDPTLIQAGREPMIEKAVQYILEELKKNPPRKVKKPEGPNRS